MLTVALEKATQIPSQGPRKAAIALAARFEAAILLEPRGVFGPERDLVLRYDASPKVVRQALRILEARFLGTVRRGVHGGLVLRIPDLAESAELMAIYLSAIGAGGEDVGASIALLMPELKQRSAACRDFATSLLGALNATLDDSGLPQMRAGRSRALVIARRIVLDLQGRAAAGTPRVRLGTLVGLEEEHSCGRPIILQAIRILEELEIIESQLGRGGGIVLRKPSPGAVVRALYPHFVLRRLTMQTCRDTIWSINRALAVRSAAIRSDEQAAMLGAMSDVLRSGRFQPDDYSGQITLWRMLGDFAGDAALHMLVRCLFYFQVHADSASVGHLSEPITEVTRANTCKVAMAVCKGDGSSARRAVALNEKVARLAEF